MTDLSCILIVNMYWILPVEKTTMMQQSLFYLFPKSFLLPTAFCSPVSLTALLAEPINPSVTD